MNEDEVLTILSQDPGNSIFADYADILHRDGRSESGIMISLRGISANPSCYKGRLILSKIFFDLGFTPFCIEQLLILRRALPENKSLVKLLERLAPDIEMSKETDRPEETYAEAEFDFEDIELIDQENKEIPQS